jgi:hypothetical protein
MFDNGFPEIRRSADRGISREIRFDCTDTGLLDVLRRWEVGLSSAKVDNVNALRSHLEGLLIDGHGLGGGYA